MGIYEEVEQSYLNYALHFSLWNLNTIKGPTYEKLYNALRDEYFEELGISKYPEEFFWSKGEYKQYLRIKKYPLPAGFAKFASNNSQTNEEQFDYISYKIGRAITFIPRTFQRLIRCYRENGLRYTIRRIFQKMRDKFEK